MILWFVIVAPVVVAEVFRSPMVDYRTVALGAALPVIDVVIGRATVLHTLAAPVVVLTVVMLATIGRRLVRRRWLGVPIGLFLHLVLDATWADRALFWWPAFGFGFEGGAPEAGRSLAVLIALDLLAVGVAVWAARRYGLTDPANRQLLLRRGHLARGVLA
ncbi:MAG: hypothetical protein AAF467_22910 [Actinomycetota bacterium]